MGRMGLNWIKKNVLWRRDDVEDGKYFKKNVWWRRRRREEEGKWMSKMYSRGGEPGQLACLIKIAHRNYQQTYPLLAQDVTYFDDRS